jgi:dCMP deaminase
MKDMFFIDVAIAAAKQATCLRRKFGCTIVNPKTRQIISTGFNGSPRGKEHCTDIEWCLREELNIPRGEQYEKCRSTHDFQNAAIQAGRFAEGCHVYAVGFEANDVPVTMPKPCFLCTKMAINTGIEKYFVWTGRNIIEIDLDLLYDKYIQEIVSQRT